MRSEWKTREQKLSELRFAIGWEIADLKTNIMVLGRYMTCDEIELGWRRVVWLEHRKRNLEKLIL